MYRTLSLPHLLALALASISTNTNAMEGGGSQYPVGVATIIPGVSPTPPGFNILSYNLFYAADRLNNSAGQKAVPNFHIDTSVTATRLDYSLPPTEKGLRLGIQILVPLLRTNVATGTGPTQFQKEKAGLGDISITPIVVGWEFDTQAGHVNQSVKYTISIPTGSFKARERVNLGRNYVAHQFTQGISLFPSKYTHVGFQATYLINQNNPATNYQSGREFDIDWSAGF